MSEEQLAVHDDTGERVQCESCGAAMEKVGSGGATQDNGCDVDWVQYQCPSCGHRHTDI